MMESLTLEAFKRYLDVALGGYSLGVTMVVHGVVQWMILKTSSKLDASAILKNLKKKKKKKVSTKK